MASFGSSRRSVVVRGLRGMSQKTRYGRPKRGGYLPRVKNYSYRRPK